MEATTHQSLRPNNHGQDTKFNADLNKVYKALMVKPMTMKEVDVYTGIMRESVCRHISTLIEQGNIAVIRKRKCNVTNYPYVKEYTADKNLFPKSSNQLRMFDL